MSNVLSLSFQFLSFFPFPFLGPACGSSSSTSWSAIVLYSRRCWETFLMSSTGTQSTLFSWWLNWETCFGRKICVRVAELTQTKTFFVSEQQNLCPQHVSLTAKLVKTCIRNNVSRTRATCEQTTVCTMQVFNSTYVHAGQVS